MRVGVVIQVSTIEGARYGLPALLDLLAEYQLKATGCLSLGPDRTVPWWQRMTGPPFISDIARDQLLRLVTEDHEIGFGGFFPGPGLAPVRGGEDAGGRHLCAGAGRGGRVRPRT